MSSSSRPWRMRLLTVQHLSRFCTSEAAPYGVVMREVDRLQVILSSESGTICCSAKMSTRCRKLPTPSTERVPEMSLIHAFSGRALATVRLSTLRLLTVAKTTGARLEMLCQANHLSVPKRSLVPSLSLDLVAAWMRALMCRFCLIGKLAQGFVGSTRPSHEHRTQRAQPMRRHRCGSLPRRRTADI